MSQHTMHNATEEAAEDHSNKLRRLWKAEAEAVTAPQVAPDDLDPVRGSMAVKAEEAVNRLTTDSGDAAAEHRAQELAKRQELRNELLERKEVGDPMGAGEALRRELDEEFLALNKKGRRAARGHIGRFSLMCSDVPFRLDP